MRPNAIARSLAFFVALSFLGLLLVGITWILAYRLTPEHRRRANLRWLLLWSIRGFVVPMIVWTVMNLGISWDLQPFMPEVQDAQNSSDPWFPVFLGVLGAGA